MFLPRRDKRFAYVRLATLIHQLNNSATLGWDERRSFAFEIIWLCAKMLWWYYAGLQRKRHLGVVAARKTGRQTWQTGFSPFDLADTSAWSGRDRAPSWQKGRRCTAEKIKAPGALTHPPTLALGRWWRVICSHGFSSAQRHEDGAAEVSANDVHQPHGGQKHHILSQVPWQKKKNLSSDTRWNEIKCGIKKKPNSDVRHRVSTLCRNCSCHLGSVRIAENGGGAFVEKQNRDKRQPITSAQSSGLKPFLFWIDGRNIFIYSFDHEFCMDTKIHPFKVRCPWNATLFWEVKENWNKLGHVEIKLNFP